MVDATQRLDTVKVATYKVGGRLVDANGEPVKQAEAPKAETPKAQASGKPQGEQKKG